MQETVKGTIADIRFRNEENGYTVATVETDNDVAVVVGVFPPVGIGSYITAEGSFVEHSRFGRQLKADSVRLTRPDTLYGTMRFLGSGLIKGVGQVTAKAIVDRFGGDTLSVIENSPDKLAEIKGISESKAMSIYNGYCSLKKMQNTIMFLQGYGVSVNLALKIYNVYKEATEDVLSKNPYKLIDDVDGVGFATADKVAHSLGIAKDSVFRVRAGVVYTLGESGEKSGNTFLFYDDLKEKTRALLDVDLPTLEKSFDEVLEALQLGLMVSVIESRGKKAVALTKYLNVEKSCAARLVKLNHEVYGLTHNFDTLIDEFERLNGLKFHEGQRKAILSAAENGVSVITGGPGTGKTTIVKCICGLFMAHGLKVELAAPTGRAAKRMSEATGREARTIHRLLELSGMQEESSAEAHFARNRANPLEADVIIIDEMSMVDIQLMQSLLEAAAPGTRLILVGDRDQLPSVGPGNVLKDIIQSGRFHVVRLTRIFRQAEASDIILNAHRINRGEPVDVTARSRDFLFIRRPDANAIINAAISLICRKLPDYLGISMNEIQVIAPMRKGALGVERLNKILQEYLNPPSPDKAEKECPQCVFREGDKVMQIKNDYQLEWETKGLYGIAADRGSGVFNGDIGVIRQINSFAEELTVEFDEGRMVTYEFSGLDELELAYAITIHKSQGSEYPAVVIPLLSGPRMLMTRNLLYTAVTRARSCVCVVGLPETFLAMEENETEQRRYSSLDKRLEEM